MFNPQHSTPNTNNGFTHLYPNWTLDFSFYAAVSFASSIVVVVILSRAKDLLQREWFTLIACVSF